jgi:hypothetical protein
MIGHQQRLNPRKMIDDKNDGSGGDVPCGAVRKRVHGLITGSYMNLREQPIIKNIRNLSVSVQFHVAVDTPVIYTYGNVFIKKNKA